MRRSTVPSSPSAPPRSSSASILNHFAPSRHFAVAMVLQYLASINDRLQALAREHPAIALRKPREVRRRHAQAKGLGPVSMPVFAVAIRTVKAKGVFR